MSDFDYYDHIAEVKEDFLNRILEELEDVDTGKEIYFHDIGHEVVDESVPWGLIECATIIEESGNEDNVDQGFIDMERGFMDGIVRPMAYDCTYQAIFDDNFFQYLQEKLNNETVDDLQALVIKDHILDYMKNELNLDVDSTRHCYECGEPINFSSEGETYDYSEDENGNTVHSCEGCLDREV